MMGWAAMIRCRDMKLVKLKKEIHKLFKSINLKIDLKLNLTQVNLLDVTFNIKKGKFWPYRKPNSEILYINKSSNHRDNIEK